MTRLDSVAVDDLQEALASVEEARPAIRLVAAIAHKHGVPQSDLADWLDVERKTIYNWFTRLESGDSLAEAARDRDRPGRPRRLTDEQRETVAAMLEKPPSAVGMGESDWSPAALQHVLADRWGVEYSRASCRRLLAELQ